MTDRENPKCPYCGNEMKAVILEERGIFFGEYQCRACQAYAPNAYGFKTFREALEAAYEAAMKRPLQKPLKVEEAAGTNEPVWYEYYKHPIAIPADVVYSHSAPFLEVHKLGSPSILSMREDAYGKTWRCWAEKPTEAERKAAEWLE